MVMFGPDVVRRTPLRRLERMAAARERLRSGDHLSELDMLLHVGDTDLGKRSRWIGKGSAPRSDWETDLTPLEEFREGLARVSVGLPPRLSPEEIVARENAKNRERFKRLRGK